MRPRREWRLPTRRLGRRVLLFDSVDSTNTVAARLAADPANDGVAVLAGEQTAGRGRFGRSWQCTPGAGVLLSLLLLPPAPLRRPPVLTAWAAVSICETVREVAGLEPRIKWPNDVLVSGRKVCGILIEQGRGTVVGIGLNVNQRAEDFAEAGLEQAASIAFFTGRSLDCRQTARRLIERLDEEYDRLLADPGDLEARWRRGIGLTGQPVRVERADGTHQGWLRELTWETVVLQDREGSVLHFAPESVFHLTPAG